MDLTEDEISSSDDEVQFIADYTGPGFDDSTGCLICYEDEENAGCDKVTCPRCEKVCHSKCVGEWNMCQVRALAAPWAGVLAQTAEEAGPCPCCR
ncbi:hypothetical protein Tdes44962_MAKER03132 [Teratosphaeria destructans]|uniref:Uncharacterized protein n=1 Tax=Teratosphaeria destructans TaxID=418781 RepID=A0A9W7SR70_9PEZI|nr:hypothetical protein Tdes44962_MAKER03132 [Teratosphaeria destructans]